jgi:plasmid stabilization system protein ParE
MIVKWSALAVKHFISIIEFLECENEFNYAEKLQKEILLRTALLITNPQIYPLDRFKLKNDGSYFAFEVDNYRVSFKKMPNEIRILNVRHTKRKPIIN